MDKKNEIVLNFSLRLFPMFAKRYKCKNIYQTILAFLFRGTIIFLNAVRICKYCWSKTTIEDKKEWKFA